LFDRHARPLVFILYSTDYQKVPLNSQKYASGIRLPSCSSRIGLSNSPPLVIFNNHPPLMLLKNPPALMHLGNPHPFMPLKNPRALMRSGIHLTNHPPAIQAVHISKKSHKGRIAPDMGKQ
jgi:hypothetical protein